MIIDPQLGDVEDDASSTKRNSLFAIAGSLLAEISLPKLLVAWFIIVVMPAILLGLAPLITTGWLTAISRKIVSPISGIGPLLLFLIIAALGFLGGRRMFRAAEKGFWSLNSFAVQPGYAICREGLRHLSELALGAGAHAEQRSRMRAVTAAATGLLLCGLSVFLIYLVWPATRWIGDASDLMLPQRLVAPALANAFTLVTAYFAGASLVWGLSDAMMDQPRDLLEFDGLAEGRTWRVAHLSDLHLVGERYGYRIESGRSGPRGNDRFVRLLADLDAIHTERPLDFILVTGDVTDAGRSVEWAEFLTELRKHPALMNRMLLVPGNHDLNIVDRANPARLDLPTSPGKRLRQMRTLSALAEVQGDRVRVVDHRSGRPGASLDEALAPHRSAMARFADAGGLRLSMRLEEIWNDVFPLVLLPERQDGLGVILLNSNAETHFSFTNALGLVSAEHARAISLLTQQFAEANWVIALHHHLVEYPASAKALSERIGTALINGSWVLRQFQGLGRRAVIMHGHRHIDWVGECGELRIISAPSPMMEVTNELSTCFYIHTLECGAEGHLRLRKPERIEIPGESIAE